MSRLIEAVSEIQELIGICPCCGELFRLSEAKFLFPTKAARDCEYLEMARLEDRVSRTDDQVSRAEERFAEKLAEQRERLVIEGRKRAKRKLKKIDPVFSANDIDPQDVKVVFDPVEYIIFHGLNSERGLKLIEFVSRNPQSQPEEKLVNSLEHTVKEGNLEFETLRLLDDGSFEVTKA